jgi:hypothetical protein
MNKETAMTNDIEQLKKDIKDAIRDQEDAHDRERRLRLALSKATSPYKVGDRIAITRDIYHAHIGKDAIVKEITVPKWSAMWSIVVAIVKSDGTTGSQTAIIDSKERV